MQPVFLYPRRTRFAPFINEGISQNSYIDIYNNDIFKKVNLF